MATRLTFFFVERTSDGTVKTQSGITSAFIQPQPNSASSNPSTKAADSDSIVLTQSGTNLGQWYADIDNPVPRYDLYINGEKQQDFSGTCGFAAPTDKTIFIKKGVQISANSYAYPQEMETGIGALASPDGGDTWPKFVVGNLPTVFIFPPSELISGVYSYREVKVVKDSIGVNAGNLTFLLSLDPNGPELPAYYCDIMIVLI
jgi:hypothetical protein